LAEVYDADDLNNLTNLKKQTLMGSTEFTLHSVITKPSQSVTLKLKRGEITIKAEEKPQDFGQTSVSFDICGDLKTSNDKVFFVLGNQDGNGYHPFFKSECKKKVKGKYTWNKVHTNSHMMADDKDGNKVEVSVYEYSSSGKHKNIAKLYFLYSDLKNGDRHQTTCAKGSVSLSNINIERKYSFLDYIFGGCELGLSVAVDFTASNGMPTNPNSLHFWNESQN
jgi:copine 1/2/3